MHHIALFKGYFLGAGLIIAIGAQNAFVLKQALKRNHLFMTAITCFLCDSLLIVLGVMGFGLVVSETLWLERLFSWVGAVFLISYGLLAFYRVYRPKVLGPDALQEIPSIWTTLLALIGFSLLNPHAYIDTFLILGNIGAQHPPEEHLPFIVGALLASFTWFFGLTYGASRLTPLFQSRRAWQILDFLIGTMMCGIGLGLVL